MKYSYRTTIRYVIAVFTLALIANLGTSSNTQAQFADIGALIQAGEADASILSQEYLRPFGEGIGSVTNSGWVNRANPHRVLGFDIQVRAAAAMVPTNRQQFDINTLNLQAVELANAGDGFTPTISGKSGSGTGVNVYHKENGQRELLNSFNLPGGTGFPYIPVPIVNASLGLVLDTDIMVRFIPSTNLPGVNGSVNMFGGGLKHGINQYIPGGGLLPIDISVMGAFTNFQMEADPELRLSSNEANDYNQQVIFTANSYNINALIGYSIPVFPLSFYAGLGYESSSASFKAKGDFPIFEINQAGHRAEAILNDPVSISYDNINSPRAMAGLRFSILLLDLFADVTYTDYPVASAGFGFSFR